MTNNTETPNTVYELLRLQMDDPADTEIGSITDENHNVIAWTMGDNVDSEVLARWCQEVVRDVVPTRFQIERAIVMLERLKDEFQ